MNLDISKFDDLLVNFFAWHVKDSKTIWVTKQRTESAVLGLSEACAKASVQKRFAYCIPNRVHFAELSFDQENRIHLYADRYGGVGVGPNGGAGRTGIVDGFQLKGVGKTPLLGNYPDDMEWHFNGGMSLIDGVLEAINSEVFGHILPIGAVKSHALIYLGPKSAYMPTGDWGSERGPGALLVREACLRPAHFLRAANFQPRDEFNTKFSNDVERTRRVNRKFYTLFGDHNQVVRFVGDFLSNCANQFSFARVFRIWHGVLSPSNLSFDGRWLDLTNISFVDSGVNYCSGDGQVPFYTEIEIVLKYLEEFIYTYTKYNQIDFKVQPLAKYYGEEVDAYLAHYVARLFGLTPDRVGHFKTTNSYLFLVNEVKNILTSNPKTVVGSPTGLGVNETIVCFLENLFQSLYRNVASGDKLGEAFSNMFEYTFQAVKADYSYSSFVTAAAIHSLKKAYFSSFFTRGRIVARLLKLVKDEEPEFFEGYIDSYIAVVKWLFQNESGIVVILFKSSDLELSYAVDEGKYTVTTNQAAGEHFLSVRSLRTWLDRQVVAAFFIDNYDFSPNLLRLLVVLEGLEKLNISERNCREGNYV